MKTRVFIAIFLATMLIAWLYLFLTLARADWPRVAAEWDQYNLTEPQRQWFRDVRPPNGATRCCDMADGHPASDWKIENGHYRAFFRGKWWEVPDNTVVNGPVPVATIWLTTAGDAVRCFAPGSEG